MATLTRNQLFYKVRQHTLEMLEDRGYEVPDSLKISAFEFTQNFESNKIDFIVSNKDKKIFIHHHLDTKALSKKDLELLSKQIEEDLPDENCSIILIMEDKPTPAIYKEIEQATFGKVELFLTYQLCVNISHHEMNPKFRILTEEEIEKITTELKTPKNKFPQILSTDPMARYYGVEPGQVFEVTRKSHNTGVSITYRTVIKGKK